nr:NmrA family NAD(P)-binding protein [uncultured Allomuricauda sp.]
MKILVTGATGITGQATINYLLSKQVKIRAMVRTIDERSKAMEDNGVEIVEGDFQNQQSIKKAMTGVNRAYFCYPFIDGLPKAVTYFARAARENNVDAIVAMSQMNVHEETTSPATQNHLVGEEILNWSGVPTVHVRPALFASNFLGMAAPTIRENDKFFFPNPEARYSVIHPQDIGDVIGNLLISNDTAADHTKIYELTGPEVFTPAKLADEIGQVVGKSIEYVPIPIESWINHMKTDPYVNDFLAKHLEEFMNDVEDGRFNKTNNTINTITGHAPRTFKSFVEHHITFFN